MELSDFIDELIKLDTPDKIFDFSRKYVLHGTPHVFKERENDFYEFRKKNS